MITFETIDVSSPQSTNFSHLEAWIRDVIIKENKIEGDIHYLLCSDNYLHKINLDFLQHDTLTDIITFPSTENQEVVSGEIYFSLDRIMENSEKYNVNLNNEFARVVVHGVLHLIGYNDKTEGQSKEMRFKENFYLEKLESL